MSKDTVEKRGIRAIRIGERFRKDLGDIEGLARSIEDVGLLHPVVITPDGTLVAGRRRLAACELLKWEEVPVTVVNLSAIVLGEHAENFQRKDLLPSEAVAVARALSDVVKKDARQRQAEAGPKKGRGKKESGSGKFPEAVRGRARDELAGHVGMSGRTLEKAEAVVDAAERDPQEFGTLVEKMDATGRVDGAYRRLKTREQEASAEQSDSGEGNADVGDDGLFLVLMLLPDDDVEIEAEFLGLAKARPVGACGLIAIWRLADIPYTGAVLLQPLSGDSDPETGKVSWQTPVGRLLSAMFGGVKAAAPDVDSLIGLRFRLVLAGSRRGPRVMEVRPVKQGTSNFQDLGVPR